MNIEMSELHRPQVCAVEFDYLEEPPSLWGDSLSRLRESGKTLVTSRVLWGAHEQLRGIRDFTKSSRLRLEKFLRLAQENGVLVALRLGFPSSKDSFPAWSLALEGRTFVPAALMGRRYGRLILLPRFHRYTTESYLLLFVHLSKRSWE